MSQYDYKNQRFEIYIKSCSTPLFQAGQKFEVIGRDIFDRYKRRLDRERAEYAVCVWSAPAHNEKPHKVCCSKTDPKALY